jgi:hypothetical protein
LDLHNLEPTLKQSGRSNVTQIMKAEVLDPGAPERATNPSRVIGKTTQLGSRTLLEAILVELGSSASSRECRCGPAKGAIEHRPADF